ncbi:MAG: 4'-phosphopantetheinyl transferase superfamily protein [Bacteroidota bacterium]
MPLFKEWSIDSQSLAAIWKVEEPEAFFVERTGITPAIKNDKRRMEHLAGRFLLKHLEQEFPILNIRPDMHDKPRLADDEYFFSISHSWPYVAVVVSPYHESGIDIQTWHPRITDIQHKYLSKEEQAIFQDDNQLLTAAWSAKEAAYKWYGRRAVDFIFNLPIVFYDKKLEDFNINIYINLTTPAKMITIDGFLNDDFACAFVSKAQDWAIY